MEGLFELIPTEFVLIVAGLACLAVALQKAAFVRDEYSPAILMIVGVVFCVAKDGFSVDNIMLGVISAAVAFGGHVAYINRDKLVKKE